MAVWRIGYGAFFHTPPSWFLFFVTVFSLIPPPPFFFLSLSFSFIIQFFSLPALPHFTEHIFFLNLSVLFVTLFKSRSLCLSHLSFIFSFTSKGFCLQSVTLLYWAAILTHPLVNHPDKLLLFGLRGIKIVMAFISCMCWAHGHIKNTITNVACKYLWNV